MIVSKAENGAGGLTFRGEDGVAGRMETFPIENVHLNHLISGRVREIVSLFSRISQEFEVASNKAIRQACRNAGICNVSFTV